MNECEFLSGTIVWIAPFYNRSGFGVGARATVSALHRSGVRIRVLSVNEVESGIDDCDLNLIKSLEATPVIPPVTAIISHVPSRHWLNLKLPEPNLRVLFTTVFDCCAEGGSVPVEMLEVCRKMDQVWICAEKEREAFLAEHFPPDMVQTVCWPHPWLENPFVPPASPEMLVKDQPFRFLNISLFLPRRRWDTLIEAYLEEFKETKNVELYLKVNYPSWHPVPGKPRQDFHKLVKTLRKKTSSEASIIIDENLGTRKGIVQLIDSCNVYVSTDTASTAPVSEARVRRRIVVVPEGLGIGLGIGMPGIEIVVDPQAKIPLTPEMLLYQPNHQGAFMPQLHVKDVRSAMRRAYEMSPEERQVVASAFSAHIPGPSESVPVIMEAIRVGWAYKNSGKARMDERAKRIVWEGSQLVHHSLALINREVCLQLIQAGQDVSVLPYEPDQFGAETDPRFGKLVACVGKPLRGVPDVHVRHHWPPNLTPPPAGHWVMIQPWEFGSLPKEWVEVIRRRVDEIWVPSSFVQEGYVRSGVPENRVCVIPNGVDIDRFRPEAPPFPLRTQKRFKFLFVGGTIWRKGPDILLEAYLKAFTAKDDVCLVIKDMGGSSFYMGQTYGRRIREIQANQNAPEILYLTNDLSPADLPSLYTACDCLVHPYRAEGFGLPMAEAMACALPVIATGAGACLEFCDETVAFLIRADHRRFPQKRIDKLETVDFPYFYEPDGEETARWMRYVYENPGQGKRVGIQARQRIVTGFTWEHMGKRIMERIRLLAAKPILRFQAQPELFSFLEEGEEFFRNGDIEGAKRIFHEVLARDPGNIPALNNLGVIFHREGKIDGAMSYFVQALKIFPNDFDAIENLANSLVSKKEYSRASVWFQKALNLKPNEVSLLNSLGNCLLQMGDLPGAAEMYEKSSSLDSSQVVVREILGNLRQASQLSEPKGMSV